VFQTTQAFPVWATTSVRGSQLASQAATASRERERSKATSLGSPAREGARRLGNQAETIPDRCVQTPGIDDFFINACGTVCPETVFAAHKTLLMTDLRVALHMSMMQESLSVTG
jgi:hypothetical protein